MALLNYYVINILNGKYAIEVQFVQGNIVFQAFWLLAQEMQKLSTSVVVCRNVQQFSNVCMKNLVP